MQTFIIIITNVFNFEKKIIIVSITWLTPIKLGGKTILVNLNNFSISEACADNSSFLACTGMNVWLIPFLWIFNILKPFLYLDFYRELGLEENMDTHGMVSGLFNSCFSLGYFFLIDLIFTFSFVLFLFFGFCLS